MEREVPRQYRVGRSIVTAFGYDFGVLLMGLAVVSSAWRGLRVRLRVFDVDGRGIGRKAAEEEPRGSARTWSNRPRSGHSAGHGR